MSQCRKSGDGKTGNRNGDGLMARREMGDGAIGRWQQDG